MTFRRHILTAIVAILVFGGTSFAGDKHEARWMNFGQGLDLAQKLNKHILIDVYTDWCGWCKRMDSDVYQVDSISRYLDSQYVLVRLNAESPASLKYKETNYTESSFASYMGVSSYPTTIFAEPDGQLITPVAGYIEANSFLEVCRFFGDGYYKKMSWQDFQNRKTAPIQTDSSSTKK